MVTVMSGDVSKRLRDAMDAKKLKAVDIAAALGVSKPAVSQWLNGKVTPTHDNLRKLAAILDVPVGSLIEEVTTTERPFAFKPIPIAADYRRDLPVYAAAEGGNGSMIIQQSAIDFTYRSEISRGADCFAVYVIGESMVPAFAQGEQVIVDPRRPPSPGDDCIFLTEVIAGECKALIKRLIRPASDRWRVRQYNPAKDFDLVRVDWPRALKIVEKRFR